MFKIQLSTWGSGLSAALCVILKPIDQTLIYTKLDKKHCIHQNQLGHLFCQSKKTFTLLTKQGGTKFCFDTPKMHIFFWAGSWFKCNKKNMHFWRIPTSVRPFLFCQGFTYVGSMWNLWMWIQKGFWPIVQYRKTARRYRLCFGEAECPTSWLIFTENTLISAKNSGSYVNDLRIIMRNHQKTSPFFWKLTDKHSKFHCHEME